MGSPQIPRGHRRCCPDGPAADTERDTCRTQHLSNGTTRYDPAKAYNMYVLFSGNDQKTYLIDMDGNEVHRWNYFGFPSGILDPALTGGARGHVFVQTAIMSGIATGVNPGAPASWSDKDVGELDWDGKIVWQWGDQAPGGAALQHHDWARLPNGNTLLLTSPTRSLPGFKLKLQLDDAIYEVTPKGDLIWKWYAGDHLSEFGFTPAERALVRDAPTPDYIHLNSMKPLGPNQWFDGGDRPFAPDNIMISSRNANFIAIIDKQTGHVVWRLGRITPPHRRRARRTCRCQSTKSAASTIRKSFHPAYPAPATCSCSTTKAKPAIRQRRPKSSAARASTCSTLSPSLSFAICAVTRRYAMTCCSATPPASR